jgi:hypothetical protein
LVANHVPINIQVQNKSIGECSEMRSCILFYPVGENYTLMLIDKVLLYYSIGVGPSDAVLTAMSRGSLPSGDPTKTPTVCRSSPAVATYISSTPPITQRLHLLHSIPSSKPQKAPRAPLPAASVGNLRQAHAAGKHPPSTRPAGKHPTSTGPAGKLRHARAPCAE